ncbi:MAG: nucleoside phosphorylase [Bacteroidales bacterium]|nr:nucleoside phosphorylase [Bacteroidales bacterium]
MNRIAESELIINPDGSIYHLHLKPEHIADDIIVVGDPQRVDLISKFFDNIEYKIYNREFVTHTGTINGKRITALATGIGTDNIDIVINELDAIVNIDLENRIPKNKHRSLNIIRLGTSGALQADIPVDSFVFSQFGLGLDGLLNFYEDRDSVIDKDLTEAFVKHSNWHKDLAKPYIVRGSKDLESLIAEGMIKGITATAPGFYGPQGRVLRLPLMQKNINASLESFKHKGYRITNFEMETSALYGLGGMLGHNTATVCAIIANRYTKTFSKNYQDTVLKLIELLLNRLVYSN